MTRLHAMALPVLTGILALLCSRRALADSAPCASSLAVEADASVNARWPGLIERLREAFEGRDDIDRCAHVALTMHGGTIAVSAVLPDGRSTDRAVSRQDDVVPTLEALLVVPRRSAPVVATSSAPVVPQSGAQAQTTAIEPAGSGPLPPSPMSTARPRTSLPATGPTPSGPRLVGRDRDESSLSPGASPSSLRIELSVVTGARIGDHQVGLGVGAFSLLDLSGWLVGFEGLADRYKTLAPGWPPAAVLELAAFGGRRFRFHSIAVDLVAGPALVLQGTTTFTTVTMGGNEFTATTSSSAPRLLAGTRVTFGALSTLRTFVGVDGEVGPSRLGDGANVPDVPRLPVWTLGLALGGTVGTL